MSATACARNVANRSIALAAGAVIALLPSAATAQAYDAIISAYRRGDVERAVSDLASVSASGSLRRERDRWLSETLRAELQDLDTEAVAKLNAALLVHTELVFERFAELMPSVTNMARLPSAITVQLDVIEWIHNAIRRLPAHRPFLRLWYLLWESLRQSYPEHAYPARADYLTRALDAFPADGELLLAMGSRHEQRWWLNPDNGHRDLDGRTSAGLESLRAARDFLQKSAAASPTPSETLMRLSRVLVLLGDVESASTVLARFQRVQDGPAFQYLGFLFEGDLHERRGNLSAAARAYDRALTLVAVPQSARVARAHVAHALGERREAAGQVLAAMESPLTQADPYWWYVRGQAWRLDFYLSRARGMVRE